MVVHDVGCSLLDTYVDNSNPDPEMRKLSEASLFQSYINE